MYLSKAISKRILELCNQKNLSINKLAYLSELTQSTLQNIVNLNSNNPKLLTIVKICEGLGISLEEFFDDGIFNDIYKEI